MSCSICFDPFNASTRKQIICPFDACSKHACRSCYQIFLCGDGVSVAKCMFCNNSFTHSQVQHLGFTKTFLTGDFAKHQQDILFAQEQAMLPAAQAAVAHDRLVADIDAQIKDVTAQIKQLKQLKVDLYMTKSQIQRDGFNRPHDQIETQFIHRCADSDCNGFVSSAWKCASCDKHTCPHCRELKAARDDEQHVCNPDTLASVALLKKDTKPCPNCKVLVHKTEGCDQMFCTQCKRLWSWNTGKFELRGHNPHYLQWMRENGGGMPRDPGDVLCGREIDPRFLADLFHKVRAPGSEPYFKQVYAFISTIPHLRFHDLPRFQVDNININLNSRKAFVSNALSLVKFKQAIRRNHLRVLKFNAIHDLLLAIIQAATDIAFRFQSMPSYSFIHEFQSIIQYANSEFATIHLHFNSSPRQRLFFRNSFELSV